jgi:hypothetical protein
MFWGVLVSSASAGVQFIAFDHKIEKLMTQGLQQERGFQITHTFLPAIEAVFAHAEQRANRVDPQPLIERLQNQHDLRKRCLQESSRGCYGSPKNSADIQGTYRVDKQRLL